MLGAAPRPPFEAFLPHASVLAVCFGGYEELVASKESDAGLVRLMHLLHLRCARNCRTSLGAHLVCKFGNCDECASGLTAPAQLRPGWARVTPRAPSQAAAVPRNQTWCTLAIPTFAHEARRRWWLAQRLCPDHQRCLWRRTTRPIFLCAKLARLVAGDTALAACMCPSSLDGWQPGGTAHGRRVDNVLSAWPGVYKLWESTPGHCLVVSHTGATQHAELLVRLAVRLRSHFAEARGPSRSATARGLCYMQSRSSQC